MGFYTTFSNAVYAYSGVEAISVAAAVTQNPRRNIPIAAKRIFYRVGLFYGTFLIIKQVTFSVLTWPDSSFYLYDWTHCSIE